MARRLTRTPTSPTPEPETSNAGPVAAGVLGALGLGAGALLLRKPALAKRAYQTFSNLRLASMLSGFAPIKSTIGNLGAAGVASMEHGTTGPLRELLSMRTLRDFGRELKTPSGYGQFGPAPKYSPARVMSAADWATSHAIERGLPNAPDAASEAQRYLLQTPLDPRLAAGLENPAMKFLVPFRRTPFNSFIEGGRTLAGKHPRILAGAVGAGALAGSAIDDPYKLALTAPLASTYALPYVGAAAVTRYLRGKRPEEALQGIAPVSEYGIGQSLTAPFAPFTEPAAGKAWRKLRR